MKGKENKNKTRKIANSKKINDSDIITITQHIY